MNMSSKRVATLGAQSALTVAKSGGFQYRQMSEIPIRASLVDTLALVRSLEAQGVPSKQAEAMTSAISTVYNASLGNVSESLKETQSQLVADEFAKLRMELYKYPAEFDKMTAEDSREHNICTSKIKRDFVLATRDIHKEFVQLRVNYESAKHQDLKFAMGTLASMVAIGLSWYRMMK